MRTKTVKKDNQKRTGTLGQLNGNYLSFIKTSTVVYLLLFVFQLFGIYQGTIDIVNDILEWMGLERAAGGIFNLIPVLLCSINIFLINMVTSVEAND